MKYKLIRIYPNSPELGFITDKTLHFPQNYPEFWEPVVEKDYEILSYITNKSKIIKYQDLNINDDCNCDKYLKINSVKRLSDKEIFTIGDKINAIISDSSKDTKLTDFKIINNELTFGLKNSDYYSLHTILKPKQPLFTTEDSVDIFEGMSFYYVCEELELYNTICCKDEKKYKNAKQFSTKEKAEEYILMNKPCLSINEITNLTETNPPDWLNKELIKIVKSKI